MKFNWKFVIVLAIVLSCWSAMTSESFSLFGRSKKEKPAHLWTSQDPRSHKLISQRKHDSKKTSYNDEGRKDDKGHKGHGPPPWAMARGNKYGLKRNLTIRRGTQAGDENPDVHSYSSNDSDKKNFMQRFFEWIFGIKSKQRNLIIVSSSAPKVEDDGDDI